jgi:hypothetical protein
MDITDSPDKRRTVAGMPGWRDPHATTFEMGGAFWLEHNIELL